jgi:hypothetical protein
VAAAMLHLADPRMGSVHLSPLQYLFPPLCHLQAQDHPLGQLFATTLLVAPSPHVQLLTMHAVMHLLVQVPGRTATTPSHLTAAPLDRV